MSYYFLSTVKKIICCFNLYYAFEMFQLLYYCAALSGDKLTFSL